MGEGKAQETLALAEELWQGMASGEGKSFFFGGVATGGLPCQWEDPRPMHVPEVLIRLHTL